MLGYFSRYTILEGGRGYLALPPEAKSLHLRVLAIETIEVHRRENWWPRVEPGSSVSHPTAVIFLSLLGQRGGERSRVSSFPVTCVVLMYSLFLPPSHQ